MEHRLQQEAAHFETTVASLRASQTLHYEDVATKDTGHIWFNLNGYLMMTERISSCPETSLHVNGSQQVQYFPLWIPIIIWDNTWWYAFFFKFSPLARMTSP